MSNPERVLEALKQKALASIVEKLTICVSIPERVLEALKPPYDSCKKMGWSVFQSLKGF